MPYKAHNPIINLMFTLIATTSEKAKSKPHAMGSFLYLIDN